MRSLPFVGFRIDWVIYPNAIKLIVRGSEDIQRYGVLTEFKAGEADRRNVVTLGLISIVPNCLDRLSVNRCAVFGQACLYIAAFRVGRAVDIYTGAVEGEGLLPGGRFLRCWGCICR